MPHSYRGKRLKLETSATYRINVQGCLNGSWSDRLSGMRIIAHNPKEQEPVTTLEGRVRDQAELTGVFNSLYELHLPLLSVELLDGEEPGS